MYNTSLLNLSAELSCDCLCLYWELGTLGFHHTLHSESNPMKVAAQTK